MGRARTVVIADDDNMMRQLLKLILQSQNYQVVGEATNGVNAVALSARLSPDLVLLDINMPTMNGLQALEEIHKTNPAVKVMMVSAEATLGRVAEAIKMGASGFVVKPLNAASVLDRIGSCFKEGT